MSSKYDSIKTAEEMVQEVIVHGLSTNQDDLCRVQDIFGNSPIEDLDRLANDIGRNNEYGEPDPKGTWSSSRRPTRDVFYMILFNIWNWEDATRFWNQHSNPEREELVDLRKSYNNLSSQLDKQIEHTRLERDRFAEQSKRIHELDSEVIRLTVQLDEKDLEITRLKAKLYDMMLSESSK